MLQFLQSTILRLLDLHFYDLKENKKISDLLFFIPLCCMFFLSYLTYWNLTSDTEVFGYYAYLEFFSFYRALKPIFLAVILIKVFFFSEYSKKHLLYIGICLWAVFLLCRFFYPNYYLLYMVSFCFAAKGVTYQKISKVYFGLAVGTFLLTLVAFMYGIITDFIVLRGDRVRHSLGLVHPNSLGMWGFLIVVYYLQYKQSAARNKDYIIMLIFNIILFNITNSRASFALCALVMLASFFVQHKKNNKILKTASIIMLTVTLSAGLIWLLLCAIYHPESYLYQLLDRLFSGRIRLCHAAVTDYPPSFWGHNIHFPYYVDPLFTYTLVIYGYVGLGIFLSFFYYGAIRSFRKRLPYVLIAFMVMQLYNMQENVFLYHLFDVTLFTALCDWDKTYPTAI